MISADQVIEEIRESRHRLSEERGHDINRFILRMEEFNEKYRVQVEKYRKMHFRKLSVENSEGDFGIEKDSSKSSLGR